MSLIDILKPGKNLEIYGYSGVIPPHLETCRGTYIPMNHVIERFSTSMRITEYATAIVEQPDNSNTLNKSYTTINHHVL